MAKLLPLFHERRKISNDPKDFLGRVAQIWNPCAECLEDSGHGGETQEVHGTASSEPDAKSPRQHRVYTQAFFPEGTRQPSVSGPPCCAKSKMQGVFSLDRGY